jgi:hypothetical protein
LEEKDMLTPRLFAIGGFAAGLVLVAAGIGSAVVGYQGRADVRETLTRENIIAPQDSTIPGQLVNTGDKARAQAAIIRQHQLDRTGGLTYAEMGRFATADGNPAGTNVAADAAVGPTGNPLPNTARDGWITATALITALETAFFAEQVGNFAILMGFALLLTGIGLTVLTAAAILHIPGFRAAEEKEAPVAADGQAVPAA